MAGSRSFIDDEPFILISQMILAPVKMSADGSAVAYVKNRDKNRMMADLYVQMAGEKAYRVDQKVGYYSFDFFNG